MRAKVQRARGLLRRYQVDRRLPPDTKALYTDITRLKTRSAALRRRAEALPVIGRLGEHGHVAFLDGRRLATSGPLDTPATSLALATAHTVCKHLEAVGTDPFVVDREADRVIIGIELQHRAAALGALNSIAGEDGWFLEWHSGSTSGVVPLDSAADARQVAKARSWAVFRSCAIGDRATGPDLGVLITFWIPGPSGQLERIGFRGQHRFDQRSERTVETIDDLPFPGRTAFPVGSSLERFHGPIDVVYTWVDGSDPKWIQNFRDTAAEFGRDLDEASLDPARFTSRDELRFSLRSLWMYCGWVRNIYVVTAGQRPDWLIDGHGVRIVDHSEIFPPSALPTFNSHSIEASLHNIDGLSEHFIYFNDDMLLRRPLRPETFFHSNGLPYWFPSDARVPGIEVPDTQAVDTAALRGRELLHARFGRIEPYKPLHSPYPLRRSVLAEIEETFPEVVEATRHSRFRSPTDLSLAASFAQHYAFATGRSVTGQIRSEYVHVESGRLSRHLDRIRLDDGIETWCINETQHDGSAEGRENTILRFFEEQYPIAAPWERD